MPSKIPSSDDWTTEIERVDIADVTYAHGTSIIDGTVKYYKTYFYYSGSIISEPSFKAQGYQDNFTWIDHAHIYSSVITEYTQIKTYQLVGQNTETFVDGTPSETTEVYDWVTTETMPEVETQTATETLYTYPNSAGIIVETSDPLLDTGLSSLDDSHTHEELFTDNPSMTHSHKAYTIPIADGASQQVTSEMSANEAGFVASIFGSTVEAPTKPAQASSIYRTTVISKNVYTISDAIAIKQKNLREIQSIESAFSASINKNLVGYTT